MCASRRFALVVAAAVLGAVQVVTTSPNEATTTCTRYSYSYLHTTARTHQLLGEVVQMSEASEAWDPVRCHLDPKILARHCYISPEQQVRRPDPPACAPAEL